MKKRAFSFLVALCLMLTLLPTTALADTTVTAPEPTYGWYTSVTEGTEYTISTMSDYLGFVKLTQGAVDGVTTGTTEFSGKTVKLDCDVDFDGIPFLYRDASDTITSNWRVGTFKGVFDGQEHTIKNVTYTDEYTSGSCGMAIFRTVYGTVKNLNVENVTATANTTLNFGGIAVFKGKYSDSVTTGIYNCHVKNVRVTSNATSGVNSYIGGIVGYIHDNTEITDCSVTDFTLTTNNMVKWVGGLAGIFFISHNSEKGKVGNCHVKNFTANVASLAGRLEGADGNFGGIGGMLGYGHSGQDAYAFPISDCTVKNVNITVGKAYNMSYVGGFIGMSRRRYAATNCSVTDGSISVGSADSTKLCYVGGFCGAPTGVDTGPMGSWDTNTNDKPAITFKNCSTDITVSATGSCVAGGFAGLVGATYKDANYVGKNTVAFIDCSAVGNVNGEALAGSFIGDNQNDGRRVTSSDRTTGTGKINGFAASFNGVNYVAEVNGNGYATLKAAMKAAQTGNTVKVIKNIKVDSTALGTKNGSWNNEDIYTWVAIGDKELTLDLNGHTISIDDSIKNTTNRNMYRLFYLYNNAKMTVTGNGKIDGDGGTNVSVQDFQLANQSGTNVNLTIENGEFSASGAEIIYVNVSGGCCIVNGGTFEGVGENYDLSRALNRKQGIAATLSITGGTYIGFDPRQMDDGDLVADGSCVKESTRTDGVKVYTVAVHNKTTTSEVTKQPTYTEEGERTYYCGNCNAVSGTEPIAKLTPIDNGGSFFYSGASTYTVTVQQGQRGSAVANLKNAVAGTTVTVAVTPDAGYALAALTVLDQRGNVIPLTDRGNGTYTFQMPAGNITVQASFAPEKTVEDYFVDVPAGQYYYDAVLWAVTNGITGGVDENHFGPDQNCTRAQLVTFLWRAAGCPVVSGAVDFSDVGDGYYTEAVRWAASLGIVDGYGDGLFGTGDDITREQLVTILYRFAVQVLGMDAVTMQELVSGYGDAGEVSDYAIPAMNWALASGIVKGADGNLMPGQSCTRAEIVTMLYRLLGE